MSKLDEYLHYLDSHLEDDVQLMSYADWQAYEFAREFLIEAFGERVRNYTDAQVQTVADYQYDGGWSALCADALQVVSL